MHFIEDIEIQGWFIEHGITLADGRPSDISATSVVFSRAFGQAADPQGQEEAIAALCVESLALWDECLLWVQGWGVWPSSEDWPRYYAARGSAGERRSLAVAPAQLFKPTDIPLLKHFLQLVLENAWDAQLFSSFERRMGSRVVISHDEWVEVRAPTASVSTTSSTD